MTSATITRQPSGGPPPPLHHGEIIDAGGGISGAPSTLRRPATATSATMTADGILGMGGGTSRDFSDSQSSSSSSSGIADVVDEDEGDEESTSTSGTTTTTTTTSTSHVPGAHELAISAMIQNSSSLRKHGVLGDNARHFDGVHPRPPSGIRRVIVLEPGKTTRPFATTQSSASPSSPSSQATKALRERMLWRRCLHDIGIKNESAQDWILFLFLMIHLIFFWTIVGITIHIAPMLIHSETRVTTLVVQGSQTALCLSPSMISDACNVPPQALRLSRL